MPLPTPTLLITPEYMYAYTGVNKSVSPDVLKPAIYTAQEMHLRPWLGDNLMDKIVGDVADGNITGQYEDLLNNKLMICLAWYAYFESLSAMTYKIDNSSIVQRTSEDTQTVGPDILDRMRSDAMKKAEYYGSRIADFLCNSNGQFPEYTNNQAPQRPPRRNTASVTYGFSRGNSEMSRVRTAPEWQRPNGI